MKALGFADTREFTMRDFVKICEDSWSKKKKFVEKNNRDVRNTKPMTAMSNEPRAMSCHPEGKLTSQGSKLKAKKP
jgi:hypothetical protein